MFDYLSGVIADKKRTEKGTFVTIDITGIGYLFETTEHDFSDCAVAEKCKFYTSLIHKDDIMAIYGFKNKETRDIFQVLLSVSGVGVKMAIALLNQFGICDLISLVINGDYKELTLAKGVGTKLAQKIILELKDKLMKTEVCMQKHSVDMLDSECKAETKTIMLSLGYGEDEINKTLAEIPITGQNTEEILRKALQKLSM